VSGLRFFFRGSARRTGSALPSSLRRRGGNDSVGALSDWGGRCSLFCVSAVGLGRSRSPSPHSV